MSSQSFSPSIAGVRATFTFLKIVPITFFFNIRKKMNLFKGFIEFITVLLLFYGFCFVLFLVTRHVGSLLPPGIETLPPALEGKKFLTTRPLGKSPTSTFMLVF